MASVEGSSTISKVFVRNGGGPTSCKPSIGRGDKLEEDEPTELAAIASTFTATPSILLSLTNSQLQDLGFLSLMEFE
jgi:hypothetical protein